MIVTPEERTKLGDEFTMRDLAKALNVHKSNALRKLLKLLASGAVQKITAGQHHSVARYRFTKVQAAPDSPHSAEKTSNHEKGNVGSADDTPGAGQLDQRTPARAGAAGGDAAAQLAADNDPALAAEFAVICAWCPQLNILRMQRRDTDHVVIYQHGKVLTIVRNGQTLTISHGICPLCRERMREEPTRL